MKRNKLGSEFDLRRSILSAEKIIKTAKRNKKSWKNVSTPYGERFLNENTQCDKYVETLKREKFRNTSKLKENVDIYFNTSSLDSDRRTAKEYILKYYNVNLQNYKVNTVLSEPTNSLFPYELFDKAPPYLKKIAWQAATCYDHLCYDACSVMNRRILETLIIECFEIKNEADFIKNNDGDFLYLSDLILKFLEKDSVLWNVSRNTKKIMPKLKSIGDKSAHSRRFIARKSDLQQNKEEFRVVIEELLHICNYQ